MIRGAPRRQKRDALAVPRMILHILAGKWGLEPGISRTCRRLRRRGPDQPRPFAGMASLSVCFPVFVADRVGPSAKPQSALFPLLSPASHFHYLNDLSRPILVAFCPILVTRTLTYMKERGNQKIFGVANPQEGSRRRHGSAGTLIADNQPQNCPQTTTTMEAVPDGPLSKCVKKVVQRRPRSR